MNRRSFLLKGLTTTGAVVAGAIGMERITRPPALKSPAPSDEQTPTGGCYLGRDGKLIDVATGRKHSLPLPVLDPRVRQGVPGKQFVMVIDLAHCDGCGACQTACSRMHFIPPTRQYIKVLRMQDARYTAPYYFPQPCYHCDNPPCTKVCPVDATFKRDDGIVAIDNERCIGCRFCMAACPYQARSFNWERPTDPPAALAMPYSPESGFPRRVGTVEKCDFCPEMGAEGQVPPCSSSCPMQAIWYGDQYQDVVMNARGETARFSTLLRDNGGYRHMEELGTEPRVYYLPPRNRTYPAPPEVKDVHGNR